MLSDSWSERYAEDRDDISRRATGVRDMLPEASIEGDVDMAYEDARVLDDVVTRRAAVSDLEILGGQERLGRADHDDLLGGLLFRGAVGVALNAPKLASVLASRHALVAWDRSLPALRAVHRALPVLRRAGAVTILQVEEPWDNADAVEAPGNGLRDWHGRHGCEVSALRAPEEPDGVAATILARARETEADLVVMGAFARSRARQFLLGGTTRSIVRQDRMTVLLSH